VGRNGASSHAGNHNHADAKFAAAIKIFEVAARYFQKQNFEKAGELFEKLAEGEVPEVAAQARVHLRLCEQRTGRPRLAAKTSEDFYALGVGALNLHQLDEAFEYLKKADKLQPKREHVQYALAATQALRGNVEAALGWLQTAIALRPQNRIQARHDEDFRGLAADPRFRVLVYPQPAPVY